MRQARGEHTVETRGAGFHDLTPAARRFVAGQGIGTGLLTVYVRHTSCSLLIQENADPDVQHDLMSFFRRLVPEDAGWRHGSEGPDDMPAHVKTALTQTHLQIPVTDGRLDLGTWQGIYLLEHRKRPHRRRLTLHLIGE